MRLAAAYTTRYTTRFIVFKSSLVDINGEFLLPGIREGYLGLYVYGYSRKCTLWRWMVSADFGCKLYVLTQTRRRVVFCHVDFPSHVLAGLGDTFVYRAL